MPTLLQVEGNGWSLEIIGKIPELPPFLTTVPTTSIEVAEGVKIRCYDYSINDLRVIVPGELISPIFYEAVGYDIHFERESSTISMSLPPGADLRRTRQNSEHHFLNFGNNVGFANIDISDDTTFTQIRLEIFSRKIDYRSDYIAMREEVSGILRNLAMAANSKTYSLAAPEQRGTPSLAEWFALLKNYFDEFHRIAKGISSSPHNVLTRDYKTVDTLRARKVSRQTIDRALRKNNNGPILRGGKASLPRSIKETTSKITFDTPENRYFKALLRETLRNLRTLAHTEESGYEDSDLTSEKRFFQSIKSDLKVMDRKIEALLKMPFLRNVKDTPPEKPNSMVLFKHPLYARFDLLCMIFNGGLSFTGSFIPIGVKDTALLYEYWCFLKIIEILGNRFDLEGQTIIKFKKFKSTVALGKGKSSAIKFRHRSSGKILYVVYNRLFNKLPTTSQKPDNVIQFSSDNRFYIFDAKYRVQFDSDYIKKHGTPGPMEEDINTMHRYRDAIAIPHPITGEYERGVVIGAAVLFPYTDELEYSEHRFYKSLDKVEIGGIPLLPSSTSMLEAKLEKLLFEEYL